MLTNFFSRHETTISLGKTEYFFIVHVSGKAIFHMNGFARILPRELRNIRHTPDLFHVVSVEG